MNEDKTREQCIDPMLRAAGWNIVSYDKRKNLNNYSKCAITEYPTATGEADYALCFGGIILGVIEAKKPKSTTMSVLTQAERYSRGILDNPFNFNGYRVPFLYSTNGGIIWHNDIRHTLNRSRQIFGFHTPEALVEKLNHDFDKLSNQYFDVPENVYNELENADSVGGYLASRIKGTYRYSRV